MTAPGWYADPHQAHPRGVIVERWWSGRGWTTYVRRRERLRLPFWAWCAILPPLWPVGLGWLFLKVLLHRRCCW